MTLHVRLTQYDLLEDRKTVIAEGTASLEDGCLRYWEDPERTIPHRIVFGDDEIRIERTADIRSVTRLCFGKKGMTQVFSPYGELRFETELLDYTYNAGYRSVEYRVFQGMNEMSQQRMVWELEEIQDE